MKTLSVTLLCAVTLATGTICASQQAHAGTITAVGAVTVISDRAQMGPASTVSEGRFDEGPTSGDVPLNTYSALGLTMCTGALSSCLAGVTTPGNAATSNYDSGVTLFPAPIGGGGEQTGAYIRFGPVARFSVLVTKVGLTASKNGTQYLTVWDTNGTMIGQVTWAPANDSSFVGINTGGVAIGMFAYGNDDLWAGATYGVGGVTIFSDTLVWSGPCNYDGVLDAYEQCDDGNTTNGDGCNADCELEYCGNGVVDLGEVCDDGNTTSGDDCSSDCASDETCGNGIADTAAGEQCDDGDTAAGDGCSATCQMEYCGNGVVDPGEVCDDGNATAGDGCSAGCLSNESCGNDVVDSAAGEQCDDGGTAAGDGCSATCLLEVCGNGISDPGEVCDDGNATAGDGCSADCQSNETCGNGVVDVAAGEACDDGNNTDGDGCQANCSLPTCGDGTLDSGEVCDDGNTTNGDGCSATCASDETCGNGVVDSAAGENCDDGNGAVGDGCSASCRLEYCGNATPDPGEVCDDGNRIAGDGCSADCQSNETCGNGIADTAVGEACDDGNNTDGDGCQGNCTLPTCGDGLIDAGEVCDDGNNVDGDGCSSTCISNESCGNGVIDVALGEACDDGNTTGGDGCSTACLTEYCGNGEVDVGEECDDGSSNSSTDPDACRTTCLVALCGDGVVDTDEECDDGVANSETGVCSSECMQLETPGAPKSGCGCRMTDSGDATGLVPIFLLLGLFLLRRRRRG
jgi:MYXO-CTERM domain-containing protein